MSVRKFSLVLVASVALVAAGCSSSQDEAGEQPLDVITTTTAEPEAPTAESFVETGPYSVGVTSLEIPTDEGATREVVVWYPGDADEVAAGAKDVFLISDLLPEEFQGLVPDESNPELVTNAVRDVSPDDAGAPYPVYAFSHGFGGYPTEYQAQLTHAASWGFVVVAPVHFERGILSILGTQDRVQVDEGKVVTDAADAARAASATDESPLFGLLDSSGPMVVGGHSAGTGSAFQAATGARSSEVLGSLMLAGGGGNGDAAPTTPTLFIAAEKDFVIEIGRIRESYEGFGGPKQLVVLQDAGHLSMTDICTIGRDQGGLLQIAEDIGLLAILGDGNAEQIQALAGDGCTDEWVTAEETWPATHHLTVAFLRWLHGIDETPAALDTEFVGELSPLEFESEGGF